MKDPDKDGDLIIHILHNACIHVFFTCACAYRMSSHDNVIS